MRAASYEFCTCQKGGLKGGLDRLEKVNELALFLNLLEQEALSDDFQEALFLAR